jgi:glycosyltransferase involved in cell wall biosynthesis
MYNAEKFLDKCINSILEQTYRDLEVITVDNNSTDNSYKICAYIAKQDKRFKAIKEERQGANFARLAGFRQCTGKYVMFVDSDDWIDRDMIEKLVGIAEKEAAEIVKCNYLVEYADSSYMHNCGLIENQVLDKDRLKHYLPPIFLSTYHFHPAWGQLIRKDIIKEEYLVDVGDIVISEDYLLNAHLYSRLNSFYFVSDYFYHYNAVNPESLTYTVGFEKMSKCLDHYWRVYEKIYNLVTKWHEPACATLVAKFINETQDMVAKIYKMDLDDELKARRSQTVGNLLSHPFFVYITDKYHFEDVHIYVEKPELERLIYNRDLAQIENLFRFL